MRIRHYIALVALCAAIAGCGEDTPTEPRAGSVEISPDVFVVDEKAGLSLVDMNDSVLVYDVPHRIPAILPGAVVVGTEGGGYIRRAQSIVVEGNRIFLRTMPAVLTDAVITGILDATTSIGFSGGAASARNASGRGEFVEAARGVSFSNGGLDLSNVVLFSGDSGGAAFTVTIESGRVEFEPAIDLSMRIIPGKLHRFRVSGEGDLRLGCDVRVESSGRVRYSRRAPIASVCKAVVRNIGSVPVVAIVTMSFVAGFDVSSDSAFTGEMGIDLAGVVQCGMKLEGGSWSRSLDVSPSFVPRPFLYDGQKGARVEFTFEPRITVEFFGLPSVDLAFGPVLGLVEQDEGFPVLAWELFVGYSGAVKFDRGALDRRTAPYDPELLGCCGATLASGPFRTDSHIFVRQWEIEGALGGIYSYPRGIAVNAAGEVYVIEAWNGEVQKFTSEGVLLGRWGGPGTGNGQFETPEKVAVDEDGFVYVVDGGNYRIQKFSSDGTFILTWGSEGTGDGLFRGPVGVAAHGGAVYVTDGRNNRVQKFTPAGDFLGSWGEYGAGPGQFNGPMGIAVSPDDGSVLVADCQNHRIQRFSPDGVPLSSWGSYGAGDEQFNCAIDVTVATGGAVFAADLGNDRFVQYGADGTFVTKLGTRGTGEGQFDHPEGVAVDARGFVYVVDARNGRIQQFAPRAAERRIRLNR